MEQWKDIPGYEGLYQASDQGRIRTCEGKVTRSARFEHRTWKQRIMKLKYQKRPRGHGRDARVCLWKDGKEYTYLVARLVARAWCEGYAEGLTVNHIDGNSENNRADNLEWITGAENTRKGYEAGLFSNAKPVTLTFANGTNYKFISLSKASAFLGKNPGYISSKIKQLGCNTLPGDIQVSFN